PLPPEGPPLPPGRPPAPSCPRGRALREPPRRGPGGRILRAARGAHRPAAGNGGPLTLRLLTQGATMTRYAATLAALLLPAAFAHGQGCYGGGGFSASQPLTLPPHGGNPPDPPHGDRGP